MAAKSIHCNIRTKVIGIIQQYPFADLSSESESPDATCPENTGPPPLLEVSYLRGKLNLNRIEPNSPRNWRQINQKCAPGAV